MSGLDYSAGCVNFRDVGEFLHVLSGRDWLPSDRLLRGGKLEFVSTPAEIGSPGTIFNLRTGRDPHHLAGATLHFPTDNVPEVYDTGGREMKRWLRTVVSAFQGDLTYPVMVHCTSGKDRTGVVVAALLHVLEVPHALIVEEYLLSDGEIRADWIEQALAGIGSTEAYFRGLDLAGVRANLRGPVNEPSPT